MMKKIIMLLIKILNDIKNELKENEKNVSLFDD